MGQLQEPAPGHQFLEECVTKAQQAPPEQRTAEQQALLDAWPLLTAWAAAMPVCSSGPKLRIDLPAGFSEDDAAAALLNLAQAIFLTPMHLAPAHSQEPTQLAGLYVRACFDAAFGDSGPAAAAAAAVAAQLTPAQIEALRSLPNLWELPKQLWPSSSIWVLLVIVAHAYRAQVCCEFEVAVHVWQATLRQLCNKERLASYQQQLQRLAARAAPARVHRQAAGAPEEEGREQAQQQAQLTVQQLQYLCHRGLVLAVCSFERTRSGEAGGDDPESRSEYDRRARCAFNTQALASAQAMLQLQPDAIDSHIAAAEVLEMTMRVGAHSGSTVAELLQCLQHRHCALQLSRELRSDYGMWEVGDLIMNAIYSAAYCPHDLVSPARMLAWLKDSKAALRRCKRILPARWVQRMTGIAELNEPVITIVRDLAKGHMSAAQALAAYEALRSGGASGAYMHLPRCDCCNKPLVARKKCAGCRQAFYCSSDCQKQHWKVHKQVCQGVKKSENKK